MWVTQTYIGTVEPSAKAFVYYFFEDYNEQQKRFTERVQLALEKLSDVFGEHVSLLMPNPRYTGSIESEIRENRELWEKLNGQLPGLFVSTVPLKDIQDKGEESIYISFKSKDFKGVAEAIQEVRRIAGEFIDEYHDKQHEYQMSPSIFEKIFDAVEMKPGIAGFRIDLRKLFKR